ncbi:MAG: glutamate racemase, partial [Synechococcaceae bacterium WB6_1A_059]|nr:glutamate racemase [Synechococcaceae bacterium WB6_1A_059]
LNDLGSPQLRAAAKSYLQPLLAADVEAIVLGCTHYPLLEALLKELIPTHIELVDPALAAVDVLSELLAAPILNPKQASAFSGCRLLVTGDPKAFAVGVERWLGFSPKVEHVSLQQPC